MMQLLAAIDPTLIKVVVILIVIGFSLVNQIITAARKARAKMQPPEVLPRPDQAPELRGTQDKLHDEVEAFLRRAKEQAKTSPPQPPRPTQTTSRPQQPPQPQRTQQQQRRKPKKTTPEVIKATAVDEPLSKRHITSRIEERDSISGRNLEQRLGSLVSHESEFETQVGQGFNRTVGTLGDQGSGSAAVDAERAAQEQPTTLVASTADKIASMLSSPDTVREAVILNEILTRPVGRW
jgi:hypothetical protein